MKRRSVLLVIDAVVLVAFAVVLTYAAILGLWAVTGMGGIWLIVFSWKLVADIRGTAWAIPPQTRRTLFLVLGTIGWGISLLYALWRLADGSLIAMISWFATAPVIAFLLVKVYRREITP